MYNMDIIEEFAKEKNVEITDSMRAIIEFTNAVPDVTEKTAFSVKYITDKLGEVEDKKLFEKEYKNQGKEEILLFDLAKKAPLDDLGLESIYDLYIGVLRPMLSFCPNHRMNFQKKVVVQWSTYDGDTCAICGSLSEPGEDWDKKLAFVEETDKEHCNCGVFQAPENIDYHTRAYGFLLENIDMTSLNYK